MRKEALKEVFRWASRQKDKEGRSLLERARAYLLENPTASKYNTELEWKDGAYEWNCDCPHTRFTGRPCKHVIAKIILMEREELVKNRQWAEWFSQYDEALDKVIRETFDDFGNF